MPYFLAIMRFPYAIFAYYFIIFISDFLIRLYAFYSIIVSRDLLKRFHAFLSLLDVLMKFVAFLLHTFLLKFSYGLSCFSVVMSFAYETSSCLKGRHEISAFSCRMPIRMVM